MAFDSKQLISLAHFIDVRCPLGDASPSHVIIITAFGQVSGRVVVPDDDCRADRPTIDPFLERCLANLEYDSGLSGFLLLLDVSLSLPNGSIDTLPFMFVTIDNIIGISHR